MENLDAKQDNNIIASGGQKEKLGRVRRKLVNRFPKYAFLKNRKIIDNGNSTPGGAGCTNGMEIRINANMDEEEQIAVLAHEAEHIKRGDCEKSVEDPLLWNIATDAVINEELRTNGIKLSRGINIPGAQKMGAEKLYKSLLAQKRGLKEQHEERETKIA